MSDKLTEMITTHEGKRRFAYRCTSNALTIGVGRNIDANKGGLGLSDDEIDYLLSNDIARCKKELTDAFSWFEHLNEPRQAAMIDMCFNMGLPRLKKFVKALAAMSIKDYEKAGNEFYNSRWADQVGSRAIKVVKIIKTGEWV